MQTDEQPPELTVHRVKNIAPIPEHSREECTYHNCYRCCERCNYDLHKCPACGEVLDHDGYEHVYSIFRFDLPRHVVEGLRLEYGENLQIRIRHHISDCRPDLFDEEGEFIG